MSDRSHGRRCQGLRPYVYARKGIENILSRKFLIVLTTAPNEEKGQGIARTLVAERLAACVTVGRNARSFYWWEGKICGEEECVLLIKTKASLYSRLEKRIKEIHPYKVPEIIALPIEQGSAEYLDWLDKETQS